MLLPNTKAPDFTLCDQYGNKHSLVDFLGQKVVLYFYPKDLTTGCTAQALGFKEEFEKYQNQKIMIIGISKDSINSHLKFVEKYNLPFILLSDESLEVIKAYDVWHEKKMCGKTYMGVVRTTYVIDENGIIIFSNDKVKAAQDAQKMLETVK